MAGHPTQPTTNVLHALRVKGFAEPHHISQATELPEEVVSQQLEQAESCLLVVQMNGSIRGWRLTAAGKDEHRTRLDEDLSQAGCRDAVDLLYRQFVDFNQPFKELCTEWQLSGKPVACIDQLVALDGLLAPILHELAQNMQRFTSYGQRFSDALTRLCGGDTDALTKPLSASYHDVWMELHQDLLLTLDLTRSSADGH